MISWQLKGFSRFFSSIKIRKHQFFSTQPSLWSNSHILYMTTIALTKQTFVSKVMSLLLNMPSRFVIAFLPRSKHLLVAVTISGPWFPSLGCEQLNSWAGRSLGPSLAGEHQWVPRHRTVIYSPSPGGSCTHREVPKQVTCWQILWQAGRK